MIEVAPSSSDDRHGEALTRGEASPHSSANSLKMGMQEEHKGRKEPMMGKREKSTQKVRTRDHSVLSVDYALTEGELE